LTNRVWAYPESGSAQYGVDSFFTSNREMFHSERFQRHPSYEGVVGKLEAAPRYLFEQTLRTVASSSSSYNARLTNPAIIVHHLSNFGHND